mgnify:CR=1 FL=1
MLIDNLSQQAAEILDSDNFTFMIGERELQQVEDAIKRLEKMGERGKKKAAKLKRDLEKTKKANERWRERLAKEMEEIPEVKPYLRQPGDEMKPLMSRGLASRGELVDDDWAQRYEFEKLHKQKQWRRVDENGAPMPGPTIYRESVRLAGRKYTFEVDSDGVIVAKKGRKEVGRLVLDRGFTHMDPFTNKWTYRSPDPNRHHIEYVTVNKSNRRRGVATEMARVAEHVYGGRVEHSANLTKEGRAWRDSDMDMRGSPGAKPWENVFEDAGGESFAVPVDNVAFSDDGFASRGPEKKTRRQIAKEHNELGWRNSNGDIFDSALATQEEYDKLLTMPKGEERQKYLDEVMEKIKTEGRHIGTPGTRSVSKRKLKREAAREERLSKLTPLSADLVNRLVTGNATAAEKLGITPEQLRQSLEDIAIRINDHIEKYLTDSETREWVNHGLVLLAQIGNIWIKNRFGIAGQLTTEVAKQITADARSEGLSFVDVLHDFIDTGIYEALIFQGELFANLVATEMSALGAVTRQKAKEMVQEIKARMEKNGEYIGTMTREQWNRLRGAWARVRPTAPIPGSPGMKQWIVAGSSPLWAELSLADYQAKSRITSRLQPTDTRRWADLATKAGKSPELIDIAAYRAGIGYGKRRIKPRDVVRVYF